MANWALLQEQLVDRPVKKRAKYGIHFDNGDGTVTAHFSGKPCHYEDINGIWQPIDTKLKLADDGFYGCPHSDVRVHKDGLVKVLNSDHSQFVELPSAKVGVLDGDRIVREFPGGRQYLYITEDGFRQEIVVDKPTFPLEKFIAKSSGRLPAKYKESPLTATDANGESYTFTGNVSEFGNWLEGASYPVVIDPDFSASTTFKRIYGNRTTSYGMVDDLNYIGKSSDWAANRGFIYFDTSAIGAGSTTTQANLKLVATGFSHPTDFDYQIIEQDWSDWAADLTNATKREAAFDACLAASASVLWQNTASISVNTQYASSNLTTTYISKTGNTYFSLRSKGDYDADAANTYIFFATPIAATESYRPVLTVTYSAGGSPKHFLHYARLRSN